MNWVAVDLGISTIKASVLDKSSKPMHLSYSMGNYETTLLSSIVVRNEQVILGDYASLLSIFDPCAKVIAWKSSNEKSLIAKTVFEAIKDAAARHYNNQNIGIVLLYNNIVDSELTSIAKEIFNEVKVMQTVDVIKRIISPNSDLMLIADFGESAFRVTLQDRCHSLYQNSNESLGFSAFDMLSLIDCIDPSSHSSIEIALLGQMMQRIKILLNNGNEVCIPNKFSVKGNSIKEAFEQKMTTFLYQCFEECSNALKAVSKSWSDIEEIVFIGGCCTL